MAMEEKINESNRNRTSDRRTWKNRDTQRNTKDIEDPRGRSSGNIHQPRGRDHTEKIFPHRRTGELAKEYVESVANVAKCTVCVADRDQIVAAAGPDKKNYSGKDIHKELKQCIDERTNILSTNKKESRCRITEDGETEVNQAVGTIVSEGDAIGAVILVSGDDKLKFGEFEEKMALCGANFLGRQMES